MKLSLFITLFLIGCGGEHILSSEREIQTPDGRSGVVIQCRDYAVCWEKAGHACPNGYDIIDQQATKAHKSNHNTVMVIECK